MRGRSHTIFVTHTLLHTISFIHTLLHTIFHTHSLSHTIYVTHNLVTHHLSVGVALGDSFAWQAWQLWHWAGSGGALGPVLVAVTPRHFAWQAWHLVTSTLVLRGRRGAWSHPLSFRVAGVAHGDIDCGFAWQASHLWHWTGSGGALGPVLVAVTPRHFAWQAWHLVTSTFVLRGTRGTYGTWSHPPSFRVAGVALGDPPSFRVAGVALMALGWNIFHAPYLSHTIFHTPSLTHPLSHTTLSHTISHTTLSHTIFHTPSLTHHLSHTSFPHTPSLSPTIFQTPSFTHNSVTHHLSHTVTDHL